MEVRPLLSAYGRVRAYRKSRVRVHISSIRNWLILINERAPPIVYLLLAAGACLSGLQLFQDRVAPWELSWGIVGQLVRSCLASDVWDDVL